MEKAKTKKIKKWDEVHGETEVEVVESRGEDSPEEVAGASPSISKNSMRGVEDMVEQNDNNFDGVINNVKVDPQVGTLENVPPEKQSILEKLERYPQAPICANHTERLPLPVCCAERELA